MIFSQTEAPFLRKANTIFDFYQTKLESMPEAINRDPIKKAMYQACIIALMHLEANTHDFEYALTKLHLRKAIILVEKEASNDSNHCA